MKRRPLSFQKLSLLVMVFFTCIAAQAQMDYETAKEVTNFSTPLNSTDDIIFTNNGNGQLQNGTAEIFINPDIIDTIDGNRIEEAVSISIQLEDESNGVYISKKTKNSFIITELENGSSNAKFSYTFSVKK